VCEVSPALLGRPIVAGAQAFGRSALHCFLRVCFVVQPALTPSVRPRRGLVCTAYWRTMNLLGLRIEVKCAVVNKDLQYETTLGHSLAQR
jgi:hypothetical protein